MIEAAAMNLAESYSRANRNVEYYVIDMGNEGFMVATWRTVRDLRRLNPSTGLTTLCHTYYRGKSQP